MVVCKSEGNPLFCERMATKLSTRRIVQTKSVVSKDGQEQTHLFLAKKYQLYKVQLDPGLMAMIRSSIDECTPNQQRILKFASVIATGNSMKSHSIFTFHLLRYLDAQNSDASETRLRDCLDQLEKN
eukprot:c5730_g1_i1.p1 GENE.c5730_g1_i1~~c5730_g1_i1.p1  ORF type:complete len:127 (+),score=49.22 c5730_g1_i1:181-561(+)